MATATVYGNAADDSIRSNSATYATARSGSGLELFSTVTGNTDTMASGQQRVGGVYYCHEALMKFDTSRFETSTITAVTLTVWPSVLLADSAAFVVRIYAYDWGSAVTATLDPDYIAGASLGATTLLATLSSAAVVVDTTNVFTDAAMVAAINKTGTTYLQAVTDNLVGGVYAGANNTGEYLRWYAQDYATQNHRPYLTVTYTQDPMALVTETDSALSIGPVKYVAMGQVEETDSIPGAIVPTKSGALGQVTETDVAQIFTPTLTPVSNPMFASNLDLQAAKAELALSSDTIAHRLNARP